MSNKRVTMQTIAEACGVSRMSVSNALQGKSSQMNAATYKKILRTAEKLGYARDPQLSELASYLADQRRGKNVQGELAYLQGLNPEMKNMGRNPYFPKLLQQYIKPYGYSIQTYEYTHSGKIGLNARQLERIWDTRGVKGIFLAPVVNPDEPYDLPWDKYSWIAFGDSLIRPDIHKIDSDFRHATMLCCAELHKMGYQRIGLFAPFGYDSAMQFALRTGYEAFYYRTKKATPIRIMDEDVPPDFEVRGAAYRAWIEKQKPDAIIGDVSVYDDLSRLGYKMPKDFAFASIIVEGDNSKRFSGVQRADEALARTSIELLLSQIQHGVRGIPTASIRTRIMGHWHDGATTGKIPSA